MALETTSLEQLDSYFEKFFQKHFSKMYKSLSTQLWSNPEQEPEKLSSPILGIGFPSGMKKVQKLLLLTSIWYFPKEECSFLLNLDCERLFGKELENEYRVLSSSKILALGYWLSQDSWNDKDFYGNVASLNGNFKIFGLIRLLEETPFTGERYTGYCRGYPESSKWTPYKSKSVPKNFLSEVQFVQKDFLRKLKLTLLLKKIQTRIQFEMRVS